ncbi:hypothetical protein MMC07_009145 [Pseudocyphellaria aurata]|nr:hypothetical protein [Pseudocyphellaria aurata]
MVVLDRNEGIEIEAILAVEAEIVVEKLTKNVNANHLREIFGAYGSIQDVDLPINKQFMTNRGTAYILYANSPDAEAAIAHMHEAQLDGAVISVSIVLPRRKFSRSPPPARRGAPNFDRYDTRGPPPTAYRGGPPPPGFGGPINSRYRSPPPPRRGSPRRYPPRPDPRDHLRGQDRDRYRRDLGVGLLCGGIEGSDDETSRNNQGEGGGGGVPAIQASLAIVIEVEAEVGSDMEGVEHDACECFTDVM